MVKILSKRIRAVIRAEKKRKEKFAPKGGSFASQAKRAQVNKGYQGTPKNLRTKIKVTVKE